MSSWESAQTALDAGAWQQARDHFLALGEQTGDPVCFDRAAQAAWWLDDAQTCLTARERAYRGFRDLGDEYAAAGAAAALAYDSVLFGAGASVGLGWLARATELLDRLDESPVHGWCDVRRAELALHLQHDPELGRAAAVRAAAVGSRTGQAELEIVALGLQGLALTQSGHVVEGMSRLDSAVAAATAGDLADPMWMGKICCWLIAACSETRDLERASDWCRRVEAVSSERGLVPLFNVCRILYASVQVAQGTWVPAEQELISAVSRLSDSRRAARLQAVVQLGELRRRQGRFVEADALFAQAEFDDAAILGRAQIKFAQGQLDTAWNELSSLLRALPASNLIMRSSVLLPAVLVATARGDVVAATLAADELRHIAQAFDTDAIMGALELADAALLPAREAIPHLRESVRRFAIARLRYDEADARLHLAGTLVACGDVDAAREQLDIVTPLLEELSAEHGLTRALALRSACIQAPTGPLTPREVEVLHLVSQGLSNKEIASKLVLSEHTVHRHVANVLNKLDQPSRAAAVATAMAMGLLP